MSLRDHLDDALVEAMRTKNKERLGILKLIQAELKNKEINDKVVLTDEVINCTATKMIKEKQDAISQYLAANRPDLATKEQNEIAVISEFATAKLSVDELKKIVQDTLIQVDRTDPHLGDQILELIKPKVEGKTDMALLNDIIKSCISN